MGSRCKCKVLKLPTGAKGADGTNGTRWQDAPKYTTVMWTGPVVDFVCKFPDGIGVDEWKGWYWENGQNGTVDTRGMFPVFYDDRDSDYDEMGKTGGSKTKTLSITNIPPHNHTATASDHSHPITDKSHSHSVTVGQPTVSITDPGHNHTATTTGADGAHSHTITVYDTGPSGNTAAQIANAFSSPDTADVNTGGAHGHAITVQNSVTGISASISSVSVSLGSTATGITSTQNASITVNIGNTGGSGGAAQAFDIRPNYIVKASVVKLT